MGELTHTSTSVRKISSIKWHQKTIELRWSKIKVVGRLSSRQLIKIFLFLLWIQQLRKKSFLKFCQSSQKIEWAVTWQVQQLQPPTLQNGSNKNYQISLIHNKFTAFHEPFFISVLSQSAWIVYRYDNSLPFMAKISLWKYLKINNFFTMNCLFYARSTKVTLISSYFIFPFFFFSNYLFHFWFTLEGTTSIQSIRTCWLQTPIEHSLNRACVRGIAWHSFLNW